MIAKKNTLETASVLGQLYNTRFLLTHVEVKGGYFCSAFSSVFLNWPLVHFSSANTHTYIQFHIYTCTQPGKGRASLAAYGLAERVHITISAPYPYPAALQKECTS